MTVIAAYDDGDKYWIASDSMGEAGGTQYELGTKLIDRGQYIIGFSWSYRVADIIRESKELPAAIRGIADLRKLRDAVQEQLVQDKLIGGGSENESKRSSGEHPLSIIVVSPSGIFTLEGDYQIHKITDGYIACGSGTDVALGALLSCRKLDVYGKDAVKLAVQAAIKHITTCGGKVHVKSVEKK